LLFTRHTFKIRFLRVINNGVLGCRTVAQKNTIQILNAISVSVHFLTLLVSLAYLIYGFYWMILINCIIFSIYFINKKLVTKGYPLAAKLLGVQGIIAYLYLAGLFYSFPITLTHYYTIPLIACLFVFAGKERYYTVFFIIQLISLFFIQALYSEQLLTVSFNALSTERRELFDVILLLTMAIFLFWLVFLIVLIVEIQEQKLKKLKTRLFLVKKSLKVQNHELQMFGLAATHSLKTPLFIINSFLSKMENNIANGNLHNNDYYLQLVKESNRLSEKYSNDLMSYLSVYNIANQFELIDLKSFVEASVDLQKISYKNSEIINNVGGVFFVSNPALLEIILQNMVDNGLKYNVSPKPQVRIYVESGEKSLSVFFKDNGIGISSAYAGKIFDPFNRVNQIETASGSGLGLTISKLAAFKMNASLELHHSSNEGSVFKLDLPHENKPF